MFGKWIIAEKVLRAVAILRTISPTSFHLSLAGTIAQYVQFLWTSKYHSPSAATIKTYIYRTVVAYIVRQVSHPFPRQIRLVVVMLMVPCTHHLLSAKTWMHSTSNPCIPPTASGFNKSKLKPSVHIDLTNPIDTHLHVGKVVSPQCEISNDHVKSTVGDGHPKKHVSFADAEKAAGGEECLYVLGQNVFLLAKVTEQLVVSNVQSGCKGWHKPLHHFTGNNLCRHGNAGTALLVV